MITLRRLVEKLSRGIIIKRRMLVAGQHVPVYVSPDAQLKYLKFGVNSFDRDLIQIAERCLNKNDNVWDIGANVGVFAFAASSIATNGSVLAVEADIWLANILRKTAKLKWHSKNNIQVLPSAISESNSVASFLVASRGRASNSLQVAGGRSQMGGVREIQFVPTLTLDSLLSVFSEPNFVKIDIEGAELSALEGAQKIIKEIRPTFYIEVGANHSDSILKIFEEANYVGVSPDGKLLKDECTPNTFFYPNEKYTC